jgi:hypothetical protein
MLPHPPNGMWFRVENNALFAERGKYPDLLASLCVPQPPITAHLGSLSQAVRWFERHASTQALEEFRRIIRGCAEYFEKQRRMDKFLDAISPYGYSVQAASRAGALP